MRDGRRGRGGAAWQRTWQEEANADQHEQAEWKHIVAHDVAADAVQVLGGFGDGAASNASERRAEPTSSALTMNSRLTLLAS